MTHSLRLWFLLCVCSLTASRAYAQNGICPDTIEVTNTFYSAYDFVIPGIDEGMTVQWNFGDGAELTDDDSVSHAFMAGEYLVSAIFMDSDCPWDGPSVLQVSLEVSQCGIVLTYVEQMGGLFTVTATGGPEEYPMHWDMGDGSTIEETWVVDHIYEPGTFNVCSWYYTALCPDTVEACVELHYNMEDTCSAQFNYRYSDWNEYLFEAQDNQYETIYSWDFGGGFIQGPRDTLLEIFDIGVSDYICLSVSKGTCADTACQEVYLCGQDIFRFEFEGFYSSAGSDTIGPFAYLPLLQNSAEERTEVGLEFQEPFVLDSINSSYEFVYCAPDACFLLNLYIPNVPFLDSLGMKVYYSYDHVLVLDTMLYGSYMDAVYGYPGCILSDRSEINRVDLNTYPNPSSHILHFELPQAQPAYYFGVDALGRTVFRGSTLSRKAYIDVSSLPDGWYMLCVVSDEFSAVKPFIISH